MRVISQNGMYSFDFDRTVFWHQEDTIYAKIGSESISIGRYESKAAADAVFKQIHAAYEKQAKVYEM